MNESSPELFETPVTLEAEAVDPIREAARELEPQMREWYADFHTDPELGGEEFRTAEQIKHFLEEEEIEVLGEGIGGTGIVAVVRGTNHDTTVALRADMDALPIQEIDTHAIRSQTPGVMHACGHDAHTAGLMGGAKILQSLAKEGNLTGDVLLLFQPSEEKSHQKESGAVKMVRYLEQHKLRDNIDAFLGLHVYREKERGVVLLKDGVQSASSGEVDITLKAPSGHIKNAYDQPNLHMIFSEVTTRLSELFRPLAENNEALVASARTTYQGTAYNVLPTEAESTWVVRIASPLYKDISQDIVHKMQEIVQEVVEKQKGSEKIEVTLQRRPGYRPIIHRDPQVIARASDAARAVIPGCEISEEMTLGGEDFSFYLEELRGKEIPGAFLMVGAANTEEGIPRGPHHTPDFEIDQSVLVDLAALHVSFALRTLNNKESH